MINKINWHDGKLWTGLISLGIVLIQQILTLLGIKAPVDWQDIVALINTVLTILGMLGVVSDVTAVQAPQSSSINNKTNEGAVNSTHE